VRFKAEVIDLLRDIRRLLRRLVAEFGARFAVTAETEFRGDQMGTLTTIFTDVDGVVTAPPTGDGTGLVVTYSASDPAVTIGPATLSGNTYTADVTRADELSFTVATSIANTSGVTLTANDGSTFTQPAIITVPASTPGQAVTAVTTFAD
jgi:hypothetical protein